MRTRGFELVKDEFRKHPDVDIKIPKRATVGSMGYDFFSPEDYMVYPDNVVKIWTDIKAYMLESEGLIINIRSSMGGRFELLNTLGYIDCDYYGNPKNDGCVGIFLKNVSTETQFIYKGDAIAQGIFVPILFADQDEVLEERTGGFGSTGR